MEKTIHRDQMGREVNISFPPCRIVSLVPSITEFLLDMQAPVVGRTKFCVHPTESVKDISVIGGTKKFKMDRIRDLKPDLIIGNKEENYQEGIHELEEKYPVWMSDIVTLEDGYEMMRSLGNITGRRAQAEALVEKLQDKMKGLYNIRSGRALYLIWRHPYMAAGKGTYVNSFLEHLGYENCVKESRYPSLTDEEISDLRPDVILLSSEPFPFKEKHQLELNQVCPTAGIELVDGEMYSWYGSRLVHLI